jgi:predicted metal-binding protein
MIGKMEDEFDYEIIGTTQKAYRDSFIKLIPDLRKEGIVELLPMSAGGCGLCEGNCTYPSAPCRHPDLAFPSMEAYGLWVSKVCELSGVPYNNGKLTMTFTGCYLYN